ncbi:uncharacterized protein LOC117100984 [Anneissia japonica]|uniref:uncharacterized protein LOC117100984 n=1 Tax=Anneissia japonica TaxID=1529436 RepID=UPI0014258276|nr:uncharacterized protein LOC117100984 [Anneissia japonica]
MCQLTNQGTLLGVAFYWYGETALHTAAYWGYSSVVKLLLDTGASIRQSKNGNTPLHACFLNQDLSYDHHRNVTVALMMTDPSIISIKNNDGKTVLDLYEECECKRYETERGCLQKEELLLILKGGQLPAIDFTPSESAIPSIIQTHGPSSVKAYTEALEDGTVEVNLGTIKVIGQERAGKTCLINSCLGKKFNEDEKITDGIATTKIITRTTNKTDEWSENLTNVGNATESYERSMAETIFMKTVDNYGSVGEMLDDYYNSVDEAASEKGKTIHETPNENVSMDIIYYRYYCFYIQTLR